MERKEVRIREEGRITVMKKLIPKFFITMYLEPFNLWLYELASCSNAVLLPQLVIHPRHPVLQTFSNPLKLLSLYNMTYDIIMTSSESLNTAV